MAERLGAGALADRVVMAVGRRGACRASRRAPEKDERARAYQDGEGDHEDDQAPSRDHRTGGRRACLDTAAVHVQTGGITTPRGRDTRTALKHLTTYREWMDLPVIIAVDGNKGVLEAVTSELDSISQAIARLDTGRYGICTSCGHPIAAGRLKAVPYADQCQSCMAQASS